MMRVKFWGTRGSITTPGPDTWHYGGNTACVQLIGFDHDEPGAAISPGNPQLILDGGSGLALLQPTLMNGPWGRGQGELHILLSHYHWDHLIGLPFFAPMFIRGNRVIFYGASINDLRLSIETLFTSAYSPHKGVQNLAADLQYRQIAPQGMEVAGFQVQATETQHQSKTVAFRIQYDAHVVVYTTDHEVGNDAVDAKLVDLARKANVWILDAHFTAEDRQRQQRWGHSSHLEAVQLALRANVETAVLFHHNPEYDDKTLRRMEREARAAAAGSKTTVLAGKDGMVIEIH
jgi:ribonuclease Z